MNRSIFLALALCGSVARAQPGEPAPPPPVPPAVDPTAAAYDAAFRALVEGRAAEAAAAFDQIAATTTDPQRAASARELARLGHELVLKNARYVLGPADVVSKADLEAEDHDDGRTTFIAMTTLWSLYGGIVLVDDLNIDDYRAGIVTVAASTAVGLLGSYYGSKGKRITGAMGDAYALGMVFGMANAGLLVEPVGLSGSSETIDTTILVAGAAGGLAGMAYGDQVSPTRGQVSFAGTLGILGFASTGLALGITQPNTSTDSYLAAMAGGTDLGLAAGLVLGRDLDWSVSRGRIITLGTLLGGLSGAAAGALIVGDHPSDSDARLVAATTLAGVWGGFALTTYLTRDMNPDRRYIHYGPTVSFAPMPVRAGAGAAVVGAF